MTATGLYQKNYDRQKIYINDVKDTSVHRSLTYYEIGLNLQVQTDLQLLHLKNQRKKQGGQPSVCIGRDPILDPPIVVLLLIYIQSFIIYLSFKKEMHIIIFFILYNCLQKEQKISLIFKFSKFKPSNHKPWLMRHLI